jgi:gliding motility-associated-like protein
VSEGATYYIPNSFTPDENGLNDVFKLYSTNINSYSLFIYSRSGEEVFNSEKDILNNSEIVWEGRKHNIGDILPNDVYVYYLIIRSPYIEPGNRYKRGIVTLIR